MKSPVLLYSIARLKYRVFAFILDFLLVFNLAMVFIMLYLLPEKYPGRMQALQEQVHDYVQVEEKVSSFNFKFDQKDLAMFADCQNMMMFIYWLYFLISDVFGNGSSLGKRVFRLRVVSKSAQALNIMDYSLRAAIKALSLAWLFPLLLVNYFWIFFNKKRQAGHDLVARSIVIEDDLYALKLKEKEEDL